MSKLTIDQDGNKFWRTEYGILHREDGPAIEYYYLQENPIIKEWYLHGKYHRDGGPAIECSNGACSYYKHGVLHREDGPAHIDRFGTKIWMIDGKRHRLDGPTFEHHDGILSWYFEDKYIPVNSQEEFERYLRFRNFL